jgi:hypothetical protein
VLDKVELRLSARAEFQAPVCDLVDAIRRGASAPGFIPTKYYKFRGDLRPFGTDAFLHLQCRRGHGDHKLELLNTGEKGFSYIVAQVEGVVKANPLAHQVMRLDPAVDVPVPVAFFQKFARWQYKRWQADLGVIPVLELARMGMGSFETIYFGRRPSCVRIYNKTAEYRRQYFQLMKVRKFLPASVMGEVLPDLAGTGIPELDGMKFPDVTIAKLKAMFPERCKAIDEVADVTFEQFCGLKESDTVTRVERQIPADRVPDELTTLGDLPQKLPTFNPFERLVIEQCSNQEAPEIPMRWTNGKKLGARDYLQALGLQTLIERQGAAFARKELNRRSDRNSERTFSKFARFLPAETADGLAVGVTESQLIEMYDNSIRRQLAA